ncbi:Hypothetical protein CGLY_16555 (plasmid) [Corynebacterium glyciniphilum AJ 3170]|uniref:Uncharacterized protein n=1 Tax=Corynebacterium glyciniphilum AJ 3170 TaxID=1404245 RepID=X5DWJ8_9CORY|nr:Hypothetical protein CGLY_16555 [Corynebacterium glyciniphilum AJ 3170]
MTLSGDGSDSKKERRYCDEPGLMTHSLAAYLYQYESQSISVPSVSAGFMCRSKVSETNSDKNVLRSSGGIS